MSADTPETAQISDDGGKTWALVIPVKPAAVGKSRLSVAGVDREALARAIALDTIEAAARAASVADVVVVTEDAGVRAAIASGTGPRRTLPDGARAQITLVDDPGRGLNPAIAAGLDAATAPLRAAMLGDLPALRPGDLDAALTAASKGLPTPTAETATDPCGCRGMSTDPSTTARCPGRPTPRAVADADATGTTLLAHAHPDALRFGADSYARHLAAGAAPLDVAAGSSLRQDVDTAAHLAAARTLGLGPRTAALLP